MKRIVLFAALAAMLVITAIPVAFAQNRDDRLENRFEDNGFFFDGGRFDEDRFDGNFDNAGGVQSNEQDVESGDADQAFEVVGGGDDSNACQNVQGINNTGNAVNNTALLQYANEDGDAEIEDTGNFEISPETAIECDQQVNQAASAFGG